MAKLVSLEDLTIAIESEVVTKIEEVSTKVDNVVQSIPEYTAGTGISISNSNVISVDDTVATASALTSGLSGKQNTITDLDTIRSNAGTGATHSTSKVNPHEVTKAQVGLGKVENTALSTWSGSDSITKLGNITTGTVPLANVSGADDLKSIEALSGVSGFLKKTAANTWALDTASSIPTIYIKSASVNGNKLTLTLSSGSVVEFNNTTYDTATSATAGLIKIGYAENGKNYPVELDDGKAYVNVPWENTAYSGTGGISVSSSIISLATGGGPGNAVIYGNVGSGNIETAGTIKGSAVYGAVWNDLTDSIEVPEDTNLEPGYAYCFDGEKYYKSTKYLDEGFIGIHSDTSGFNMGKKDNGKELDVAVAGFVLAYVDKVYKPGTPLTCNENGTLTEIKLEDKRAYPERIVGTFWKAETAEEWGSTDRKVPVNGRCWIKVR